MNGILSVDFFSLIPFTPIPDSKIEYKFKEIAGSKIEPPPSVPMPMVFKP